MCDLNAAVEQFCRQYQPGSLEYNWGGELWRVIGKIAGADFSGMSCEDFTKVLFSHFREKLQNALKITDKTEREKQTVDVLKLIVEDWGGIRGNADRTLLKYADKLKQFSESAENSSPENLFGKRIATWSKILAAWAPGKYFIYDSRVAAALQILLGNQKKLSLGQPQGKGLKRLCKMLTQKTKSGTAFSYADYCSMLRESGNDAQLEKKLFMLGKWLGNLSPEVQQKIVNQYLLKASVA